MRKKIESILFGDSKDKLQELMTLDKNGVPVLKHLFEISMDFIDNLKSTLELSNAGSVEELINEVKKIKSPIPSSSSEMNKVLDELQERVRKIKNSI